MTGPCFEIVAYRVAAPAGADQQRLLAQERLRALPGFLAWQAFADVADERARVDLVVWASREDAVSAADIVGAAAEFAAFRATVGHVASMGHYAPVAGFPQPVAVGDGVEIGRFRLKPGMDEGAMRAAHRAMVAGHLARQPGWRGQYLLKLRDGIFIDLAFAETTARSVEICAGWHGAPACEAFLAMIEPIAMEFGAVV